METFDPATQDLVSQIEKGKIREALVSVRVLLKVLGEDPDRDGLRDTPNRVVKALLEMTSGYNEDPEEILRTQFILETSTGFDQMVICDGIQFTSLCEHHLLPFSGVAAVGYIPNEVSGMIVGLSKLARLFLCFAKRLQVQERLTEQVAIALEENTNAAGVAVIVRSSHSCMTCRGVQQWGAKMITSCMLGVMRESSSARGEFLELCQAVRNA